MAVDHTLAAAFIDGASGQYAPKRLLGVRVRRLCLWHRLLLNTVESPLMCRGRVTMWDLRTAVGIFRLRFGDSVIRRPWLVPALIYVGAFLTALWERGKPGKDGYSATQRALNKQLAKIFSFTGDYLVFPDYTIITTPGAQSVAPRGRTQDELEHAGELIFWSRWPESYVWELPIGRANWYRALARRDAGSDVDFTTADEIAFRDSLPPEYRFKLKNHHG